MTKQVVKSGISRAVVDLTSSIRKQKRVVLGTELCSGREGGGERERERETERHIMVSPFHKMETVTHITYLASEIVY